MSTANNNEDLQEETLLELIDLKNLISLCSKISIREGEQVTSEEINSLFTTMHGRVTKIIQKLESTL